MMTPKPNVVTCQLLFSLTHYSGRALPRTVSVVGQCLVKAIPELPMVSLKSLSGPNNVPILNDTFIFQYISMIQFNTTC